MEVNDVSSSEPKDNHDNGNPSNNNKQKEHDDNQVDVDVDVDADADANANANANANADVDPNYIAVKFVNQKNQESHYKLRRAAKIEKAFRSYCQYHNLQYGTARFILNGHHIPPTFTPADLNLKDGVVIEVYSEVHGGTACGVCCRFQ